MPIVVRDLKTRKKMALLSTTTGCHLNMGVTEVVKYLGLHLDCGPGSVVGIETGYGLDGPGIECRWGRDLPQLSTPALRPI